MSIDEMVTDGNVCPKCGSTNTHDHWSNKDDHGLVIEHNWRCHDCGWDDSKNPITNSEKLRKTMSDKRLADLLAAGMDCDSCPGRRFCDSQAGEEVDCDTILLNWLKQETKDE